jgi:hypothetical protein
MEPRAQPARTVSPDLYWDRRTSLLACSLVILALEGQGTDTIPEGVHGMS